MESLLSELEDTALLIQKAQSNLKKCPKQRLTKGYIETRLSTIDEYWNKFTTAHFKLLRLVPKEKKTDLPYFVNEDYYVVEDLYLSLQGDLRDLLSSITSKPSDGALDSPSAGAHYEVQVRLPRIELPVYTGVYEEWPSYQDMFLSLVHNNLSLTKVQKLHYLKRSLSGEAESLLRHLQVTDSNYEQAWELLKGRYGNKRLIVNSLLSKLFSQKKIPSQTATNIKMLMDTTNECLNSLKNLNVSTDSWDPLIIYLVVQKLDPESHREWEEYAYQDNLDDLPTWENLVKFLQTKFRTLELVTPPEREKLLRRKEVHTVHYVTSASPSAATTSKYCLLCHENHTLCHCREFIKLQPSERSDYLKSNNLCFNCLASGHCAKRCRLTMSCRICHKRHHSLVHQHIPRNTNSTNQPGINQAPQVKDDHVSSASTSNTNIELSSHFATSTNTALLATALVPVKDESGRITMLRALVDQGSQATFISERAAQLLRTRRTPVNGTITGVGSTTTVVKHATQIRILSRHDESFNLKVKAYILSTRLTTQLPSKAITISTWSHLEGLFLADPNFHKPVRVDLLLGVEVCAQILKSNIIKGPPGSPCAQDTSLGWILFGNIQEEESKEEFTVMHRNLNLDNMLKSMWELDNDETKALTEEERQCEQIYQATHSRTIQGEYIVKLPTKSDELLCTQGETREIALRRFHQLERRLNRDVHLKEEYTKAMEEYLTMNHMEEVPLAELNNKSVYMPHHPVGREEKETTKVRPVFNASQKGTNNVSLNGELLVGPQLQTDMRSLIMRWRTKKVCFVADIQKMYRCILVTKEDRDLQRILWRNDLIKPVKDYRLMRVTSGTASAPYLAVRTLHQVTEDEGTSYPKAAKIIKEDFYVDDLMSGEDSLESAIETAKNIEAILQRGGFSLQKWCSNNAEFMKQFDIVKRSAHVNLDITIQGTITALGLQWNMDSDVFQYNLNLPPITATITKRTILADVQRLFDPLGWLSPCLLPAKLMIQKLWLKGISWDEELETELIDEWVMLRESFQYINQIEIERWMNTTHDEMEKIEVHGFSDASTKASAAVAYVKVKATHGAKIHIIAAKTRVAPVKSVSLPRLELCGALLLSRLLKQIKQAIKINDNQIFAWTDSTIVLSWLLGDPTRWHTFVRNRVVEILDNVGRNWYHVQTKDNPADLAFRGEHVLHLKENKKWWEGQEWLKSEKIIYTIPENLSTNEERMIQANLKIDRHTLPMDTPQKSFGSKFENFDSLNELLITISLCKRFLKGRNLNNKDLAISTKELDDSLNSCIKIIQNDTFEHEIKTLKENKQMKKDSKLVSLQPFLDSKNIPRVGGRLRRAAIDEDSKHPVKLDGTNPLSLLLVADACKKTLHSGVQLMLEYLRFKF